MEKPACSCASPALPKRDVDGSFRDLDANFDASLSLSTAYRSSIFTGFP
jgi:hypothetical protein